jgi:hypothetical protein
MDILETVTSAVNGLVQGLVRWPHSTMQCSAPSQALLYVLFASSLAIAIGGVHVWRRHIRTQPQPNPV